jgi:hypothetical protein
MYQEWQNLPQNCIRRLTGSMRRRIEAIIRAVVVTHVITKLSTSYHNGYVKANIYQNFPPVNVF